MKTKNIIVISLICFLVLGIISSIIGVFSPVIVLNENQILYIFSTTSQVIAAIFGLTLTGFIFVRNELSREEISDESLTEVIQNLKDRYFKLLVYVSALSIVTILLCNFVLSLESSNTAVLLSITVNMTQSLFIVNLLIIAYFIFDVVGPRRIEEESRNIRLSVDSVITNEKLGSLEEFLTNYNKLEYIIQKYGTAFQDGFDPESSKQRRRISNVRLAEFILKAERIDLELFTKIKNLITLRNSIIHGAEPVVSERMVVESETVLGELSEALHVVI